MKKILSILLALCIALIPALAFSAGSPTVKTIVKTPYKIIYQLADYNDAFDAYAKIMTNEDIMLALVEAFGDTNFQLDEMLYINIDKPYTDTAWSFTRTYTTKDTVISIIMDESIYVLVGTVTEDKVIFDFTDIPTGEYSMLIIANPIE